jgi:hypothetical protein
MTLRTGSRCATPPSPTATNTLSMPSHPPLEGRSADFSQRGVRCVRQNSYALYTRRRVHSFQIQGSASAPLAPIAATTPDSEFSLGSKLHDGRLPPPSMSEAHRAVYRRRLASHRASHRVLKHQPARPLLALLLPNHLALLINTSSSPFKYGSNEHALERLPAACAVIVPASQLCAQV